MADEIVLFFVYIGCFLVAVFGSVVFAAQAAQFSRDGRVRRRYLVGGAALSLIGVLVMASVVWTGRQTHFGWRSATFMLEPLLGGGLILFGLGPLIAWVLGSLARHAGRLPLPIRLAVRGVAGSRVRTTPAVTVTMVATALAIVAVIGASAISAQRKAAYVPQARPGTLLIRTHSEGQAAIAEA